MITKLKILTQFLRAEFDALPLPTELLQYFFAIVAATFAKLEPHVYPCLQTNGNNFQNFK
jgi:hypothetical protein